MNSTRKRSSQRDGAESPPDRPGWLAAIVIALLTARFLLPTEASVNGETLWLVQLWILAAAVWGWRQFLAGRPMIRWDLGTLAVGLLVAGHLVSGFVLFSRGGDKRAATNLMWEWLSLGITFVIVRGALADQNARRTVISGLTCVVVALAGLGVYQHTVELPQTAKEYREHPARFEQWLRINRIPPEGPARKQFEARVLSSTEPFGTFGLANTFAGLLAVFLFPSAAMAIDAVRRRSGWPRAGMAVAFALLIVWCLLLTKSRTAWAGAAAGGLVWWATRGIRPAGRKLMAWIAGGAFLIGGIVLLIAVTGGLDRKVLSESPKSLRYRWQYWTGTAGVLTELPLFGPGPGNFRQRYLKHKLPEASEEIQDPHNLFLDVWCNGGMIALAGLLLLFAWCGGTLLRRGSPMLPPDAGPSPADDGRTGIAGIVGGFLAVIGFHWFLDAGDLTRLWALLAGSAAVWFLTRRTLRTVDISTACIAGGGAALAVHLLGAGGIEMPALTQLLLLTSAAILPHTDAASNIPGVSKEPWDVARGGRGLATAVGVTAAAAVLFGTCLSTATIPVLTRQPAAAEGQRLWRAEGRLRDAEQRLAAAAANDPLSPRPIRDLAELAYAQWERAPQSERLLDRAIELQKAAIRMDPHHYHSYWMLGAWHAKKHEIGRKPADAAAAQEAYAQAVERYPHNVRLLADYARVLQQAGRTAAATDVAKRTLELDDLNHREGHADKYLPGEFRQRLLDLVRKTERPSPTVNRN